MKYVIEIAVSMVVELPDGTNLMDHAGDIAADIDQRLAGLDATEVETIVSDAYEWPD